MRVWLKNKTFLLWLLGLSCLLATQVQAGEFSAQIKTASVEQLDDWYVLNADLDHGLSPIAKEAIQSGIPLTWCLKIQFKQIRYFHDKTLAKINTCYKIRYHALLNSYSVTELSNNKQKKYPSLTEALDSVSRIRELKIIPIAALKKEKVYQIAIKLKFDKESLPSPLRPVAYLNSEWDLSSDWFIWHTNK